MSTTNNSYDDGRGHPVQGDSGTGGNQSAFVRQTTKYWVIQLYVLPGRLCSVMYIGPPRQLSFPKVGHSQESTSARYDSYTRVHCSIIMPHNHTVFNPDKEYEPKDSNSFFLLMLLS